MRRGVLDFLDEGRRRPCSRGLLHVNLHQVVRIVGGPAFKGLGDSSWEQPGYILYNEPKEEAFGLSKERLGAEEEEGEG